jgi:NADPH-dependent 2,4-dienoyl-CoA reductase/sulfur reductase-like enzyme
VLATGAQPRRLPGAGTTLRTKPDALALRAALTPGARLVVVGAGWIGAEVATAAVARGAHVTVVEGLDRPLAGALPAEIGAARCPGGRASTCDWAPPSRRSSRTRWSSRAASGCPRTGS